MIEYGIPIRSFSQSTLVQFGTYDEYRDFDSDLYDKAYYLGFRLGDLAASRANKTSDLIYISSGSSKREQIELIERLFARYGHIVRSHQVRLSLRGLLRYETIRITLNSTFHSLAALPMRKALFICRIPRAQRQKEDLQSKTQTCSCSNSVMRNY